MEYWCYYTPKPRRLREHAQGGHGRRRRRGRVQERRRAAEGAAELLVAAGVGDVADLGDGRRGDGRRQQRRRRGRQQRRLLRRHPRVPGGRPLRRRRLGRALAVPVALAADVRRPVRAGRKAAPARRGRQRRGAAAEAAVQPAGRQQAFAVAGDCGHREVPPVPGLGAVQDPRQARLRHPPPQHRRTGEEDEDQRADTEAAGARSQHGEEQTNTSDMLDLAVDYIKELQMQVKVMNDGRASCTCAAGRAPRNFAS
uniref:BHLH domain-containing protein n=1 Tax=Aegilops tauschii subsp. strangulata TaxID=200361 RepID=A0A453L3W7_AEGTS